MPINLVKHSVYLQDKQNQMVSKNIARLWDIAEQAQTQQDILDALHPWHAPMRLKFSNHLAWFLSAIGLFFIVLMLINPANIWAQSSLFIGACILFWAYIAYEEQKPIRDVIHYLEQKTLARKYQLALHQQPRHVSIPLQPLLMISQLKQLFPLFNQGSLANDLPYYASTVWHDEHGTQHQVMVFQYRYVNEVRMRDKNGSNIKVKEVHKDLWGVFVFDVDIQGLAVSTAHKSFHAPYTQPWQTSDIQINQKLNIFGSDEMNTAKLLSPAFVLKLADFFAQRQGDLIFHPSRHILCFLGSADLFKISSRVKNIDDISALRGHLRTFRLAHLESLQRDLTQFLK